MTFASQLQTELQNLPGEEAHVEMFPLRARTSEALKTVEGYRLSAVMALLYPAGDSHHIILIERQDYDGKHSGQMSFPGGKKEDEDYTSLEAALRETHEEIGIHPDHIKVLGRLTDVYIPVSNFLVHPYVGMLESKPEFVADAREVKSVFTFDVNELLHESNRVITTVSVGKGATMKDVPAFEIDGKIIWGATALMLNEIRIILKRFS
jgi:8-oxo-dGTP pyrophosphatase MutT (NUDIX family)